MTRPTDADDNPYGDAERSGSRAATETRWMDVDDVRAIYADQADRLERFAVVNRLLTGRYRRTLFGDAHGRVLDVACGMGTNFEYLPDDIDYVGIDISPQMLEKAARNLPEVERGQNLHEMDAQNLAFEDDSFDTVLSSLSTCTFPDPNAALQEMNRVCKPEGRVLLLEHGRSDVSGIARFQDWRADAHYEKEGCRWNQEPLDLVSASELSVRESDTGLLGIITTIEAVPADPTGSE